MTPSPLSSPKRSRKPRATRTRSRNPAGLLRSFQMLSSSRERLNKHFRGLGAPPIPLPLSQGAGTPRCWGRSRCGCARVRGISHPKSHQAAQCICLPFAFHPQSPPARQHTLPWFWDVSDVVTPACTSWPPHPSSSSHQKRRF